MINQLSQDSPERNDTKEKSAFPLAGKRRFQYQKHFNQNSTNTIIKTYQLLLSQTESEIKTMNLIVQIAKKMNLKQKSILCKAAMEDSTIKPRHIVSVSASREIMDDILKSLKDHGHNAMSSRLKQECAFFTSGVKKRLLSGEFLLSPLSNPTDIEGVAPKENVYCREMELMVQEKSNATIGFKKPESGAGIPNVSSLMKSFARQLANEDLTRYVQSSKNFVFYLHFSYDSALAPNPLTLLSSRWQFITNKDKIFNYVEKKRKQWKINAETAFQHYQKTFTEWRKRNTELEKQKNRAGKDHEFHERYLRCRNDRSIEVMSYPSSPLLSI